MARTVIKRTSICLTKESLRVLEELKEKFGENSSQVVIRALTILYSAHKNKEENKNDTNKCDI